MEVHIYRLLSVAVAWGVGLLFVRREGVRVICQALLTALLCAAAGYWLTALHETALIWPVEAALFLLSAFSLHLGGSCRWGSVLQAFFMAQSAYAVFCVPVFGGGQMDLPVLGTGTVTMVVFAALAVWLRDRFPETDWKEAKPSDRTGEGKSDSRWPMYLIPVAMCVLLTAARGCLQPRSTGEWGLICLLGGTLFWIGVWLLMVMDAYRKERATVQTEQQYREEMQSFLNVIRSQRHDYNFHVQTIAGLIRQGKVEDCLHYVDALEEDAAIMNAVLPIRDPAISAMIHNFRLLAVRQGIELHVDIHYDMAQIATNVYETNKIISNLLQNAIDEVSTHEDKSYGIWLTILKRGEYCVIRVSNKIRKTPSQEELSNIYRQGYTTKTGHEGVGLSSLRTLVGRYRGAIYTQLEDDVIQFVARVPIDYAKEPVTE